MTSHLLKGGTAVLFAAFLVAGCTDKGTTDDTGETGSSTCPGGFYSGPYQIAVIDPSCADGSPDVWTYFARTDGYAGDMDVAIFETGDGNWPSNPSAVWDETHPLTNTDFDADCGTYDEWSVDLDDVAAPGDVVAGSTTLWDCSVANNLGGADASLVIMFTMYDDASAAIDCAITGYEATQYWNTHEGNSCICFDTDGDCTN